MHRSQSRSLYTTWAVLLVLSMVLAACTTVTPAVPGQTPAAQATAEPTGEKLIRLASSVDVSTGFDPFKAGLGGLWQPVSRWIFSRLVNFDGDYNIIPELAESWTISPDSTEFTFTLRQDVLWQDGEPFTAEDVVFTFQYLLTPATNAALRSNFQQIEGATAYSDTLDSSVLGIAANGDYEVTFTLTEPSATFMNLLPNQPIVPQHVVSQIAPEDFETSDFVTARPFPGTGPFTFVEHQTDQFIELQAFADYFGGTPKVDRVRMLIIPDPNTRIIAFEKGEIDILEGVSQAEYQRVASLPDVQIYNIISKGVGGVWVNYWRDSDDAKAVAMRTPQFRQAVAHALNLDDLIAVATDGNPDLAQRSLCHSSKQAHCPADLQTFDYDPARAQELLAEIGWDSTWELVMGAFVQEGPTHAVIQEQLATVGINTSIRPMDVPTIMRDFYEEGNYDLFPLFYADSATALGYWSIALLCDKVYPAGYNGTRYCNPAFDEVVSQALVTADEAANTALMQEGNRILNQDLPIIPTYVTAWTIAVSPHLTGYVPSDGYTWEAINEWELQ